MVFSGLNCICIIGAAEILKLLQLPFGSVMPWFFQVVNANVSLPRLEEHFLAEERVLAPNQPLQSGLPAMSIKDGKFSLDSKFIL